MNKRGQFTEVADRTLFSRASALLVVIGFFLAAVLAVGLASQAAWAQSRGVSLDIGSERYAGEFRVPINKSQVLRVDRAFADLLIGNPTIADVVPLTDHMVYILGKKHGSTSLSILDQDKALIAVVDLVVTHDIEGLKRRLHELLPKETIEVRSVNDTLVLSGLVSSAPALSRVMAVAGSYAPDKVTNLLSVKGSQQVMLAVRFAEVQRSVTKELGLDHSISANIGPSGSLTLSSGLPLAVAATAFGSVALSGTWAIGSLLTRLEALEHKGLVKTLAEPNLITTSGETASFLAGGEFPVPVAQVSDATAGSTISVSFKQFGVSLAFTPTVLDDGLINIRVEPEVSSIDVTNSVTSSGFQIPGISTRRAKTTVELRDGQSFAIAGLLQSDFTDNIDEFPGLATLPVLGPLFRSSDFERNETELVIIVTPYLVKPARPGDLRAPTDEFVPPSDADIFLKGKVESSGAGNIEGGGLDGSTGHIIK